MDIKTKKAMMTVVIALAALFALIFGYKAIKGYLAGRHMAAVNSSKVVTVSTIKAEYQDWQPQLKAVGSLRTVRGVDVTTELAGIIRTIYFTPGADVKQGQLLVELNIDSDIALLHSLQALAQLSQITYERDKAQYAVQAVSKQTLDTDAANLKSNLAQVEEQAAVVEKKIIRAPFTGRLGVSAINPGQYLNTGDKIVNLQTLDPIYVDFYLPQQVLSQISRGQEVRVVSNTYPGEIFTGKITTIEPMVDVDTRNIEVEATLANPKYKLLPGMFASVELPAGKVQRYLTLPQTAVSFNPYGDVVFIVKQTHQGEEKNTKLTVTQAFVTVGETRGDQIAILKGIKEGDVVVTAGQLKLKNGSAVVINNTTLPSNNPAPKLPED